MTDFSVSQCYTDTPPAEHEGDCPLVKWDTCWNHDGSFDCYVADCDFIVGHPTTGGIPLDCPLRSGPTVICMKEGS